MVTFKELFPKPNVLILALVALFCIAAAGTAAATPLPLPRAPPASGPAAALQATIDKAVASGAAEVRLPKGVYVFNASSLVVRRARHLRVVFAPGTELWFSVGGGVMLDECTNVTVVGNGVEIDYDPLPFFQATCMSDAVPAPSAPGGLGGAGRGAGWKALVEVDAGSLLPKDFWARWGDDPANEFVQGPVWWSAGGSGHGGAPYPLSFAAFSGIKLSSFTPAASGGPRRFEYTSSAGGEPAPKAGDKLSAIVRLGYTWHVHNSSACATSNVTIFSASFMAVTEFDGRGGHAYDFVRVVRRPTAAGSADAAKVTGNSSSGATVAAAAAARANGPHRHGHPKAAVVAAAAAAADDQPLCGPTRSTRVCLATVASNADVFHSSGCRRGPTVRRCEFSYALDDYLNIHSRTQVCVAQSGATVVVADPRLRADARVPDDHPYGTVETMTNVRAGDTLSFRDVNTLELVRRATVAAVERLPPTDPAVAAARATVDALKVTRGDAFRPSDVTAAMANGTTLSRVWRVTLVPSPPAAGGGLAAASGQGGLAGTLIDVDSWPASGGLFEGNLLHSSIDGGRWKSSGGAFVNNTWSPAKAFTGLEVTPLRAYYEGPMAINNVVIAGNRFVSGSPGLISTCTGMSHSYKPPWTTCTNVTVANNTYPPSSA